VIVIFYKDIRRIEGRESCINEHLLGPPLKDERPISEVTCETIPGGSLY
jgi:hypothetical protein